MFSLAPYNTAECSDGYTYYVYVDWETNSAFLCIVAAKNNTIVQVYELPSATVMDEAKLDVTEKYFVSLSNRSAYRIVSNNSAYVILFLE